MTEHAHLATKVRTIYETANFLAKRMAIKDKSLKKQGFNAFTDEVFCLRENQHLHRGENGYVVANFVTHPVLHL